MSIARKNSHYSSISGNKSFYRSLSDDRFCSNLKVIIRSGYLSITYGFPGFEALCLFILLLSKAI